MNEGLDREIRLAAMLAEWSAEVRSDWPRSLTDLLVGLIPRLAKVLPVESVWFWVGSGIQWQCQRLFGSHGRPPQTLVEAAAERGEVVVHEAFLGIPMGTRDQPVGILVLQLGSSPAAPSPVRELGAVIKAVVEAAWDRVQMSARLARQQRIVEAARLWITLRDWDRLFESIATTATHILECERATIFLWDRRAKLLIGRPALGVPGGQLVLPDDRGVVGRVIRTGQPARADSATEPAAIDRSVDERLGFRTRNVLCVPLRGKDGLQGAFEVLNKRDGQFTDEDERTLLEIAGFAAAALDNAKEHQMLVATNTQFVMEAAAEVEMVGESQAIDNIRKLIRRVADTDLTVLILGENGTGKEVVARLIHLSSRRRQYPFLAVNCAAIPEALAESELFGHERGAFTDAIQARPGKFELAGKGTLFLDEVGELSLACQAKLLRVLEERTFVRVGGSTPIISEARIIAATNQDLNELVRSKRFREDLYYRLNGLTIELPPLRARKEDILPLARHFLNKFCVRARRPVPELTRAAEELLLDYHWPGNVRELRNAMERIAYLTVGDQIDVDDLEFLLGTRRRAQLPAGTVAQAAPLVFAWDAGPRSPGMSLSEATREFQRQMVQQVLRETGGNLTEAAKRLGLQRSNFYRKLRQLGLPLPREAKPK